MNSIKGSDSLCLLLVPAITTIPSHCLAKKGSWSIHDLNNALIYDNLSFDLYFLIVQLTHNLL